VSEQDVARMDRDTTVRTFFSRLFIFFIIVTTAASPYRGYMVGPASMVGESASHLCTPHNRAVALNGLDAPPPVALLPVNVNRAVTGRFVHSGASTVLGWTIVAMPGLSGTPLSSSR
jgi:hypothetical protein